MKRSLTIIALIVTVAGAVYFWCDRRPVYAFPPSRTNAYKLEGYRLTYTGSAEQLHGWPILQRRDIDESTQAKVRATIGDWKNYERTTERGYACFDPRLAFRIGENEDAIDVLICLECRWVYFYRVRDEEKVRAPLCISNAGLRAFADLDALVFPKSAATTTTAPAH